MLLPCINVSCVFHLRTVSPNADRARRLTNTTMKLSKQVMGVGVLLVLLLTLSPAPVLGCVKYGQNCGPAYHCCSCSDGSDGWVLSCEYWDWQFKCAAVAHCSRPDATEVMMKALGLPRKMMTMRKPQELVVAPA